MRSAALSLMMKLRSCHVAQHKVPMLSTCLVGLRRNHRQSVVDLEHVAMVALSLSPAG